jgi:hypothetical protein
MRLRHATALAAGYASTVEDLAMLPLPTMDPMAALMKLRKVGEHTFRRVRKDGELAEPIVCEVGPDGKALRDIQHSNPYDRRAVR